MTASHTPGRLVFTEDGRAELNNQCQILQTEDDKLIVYFRFWNREDARRIAACWNACEGVSTDDLESLEQSDSIAGTAARVLNFQLIRQRNKLLDLLAELLDIDLAEEGSMDADAPAEDLMGRIKLAIEKSQNTATHRVTGNMANSSCACSN